MGRLHRMKKSRVVFSILILFSALIVGFSFKEKESAHVWYWAPDENQADVPGATDVFVSDEGSAPKKACVGDSWALTHYDQCKGKFKFGEHGFTSKSLLEYWVEGADGMSSQCKPKNMGYKDKRKLLNCDTECGVKGECRSLQIVSPAGTQVDAGYCACSDDQTFQDTDASPLQADGINPENVGCIRLYPNDDWCNSTSESKIILRDYCEGSNSLVEYYGRNSDGDLVWCTSRNGFIQSKKINCRQWCNDESATCKTTEESAACGGNSSGLVALPGRCDCG